MRVSLIKSERIIDTVLPERINGNFWITDFDLNGHEQNFVNIEASNEGWKLVSNDDYSCFYNDVLIPDIILKDYNFYIVKSKKDNDVLVLYCSPTKDETYKSYNLISDKELLIGKDSKNSIIYNSPNVEEVHAKISYSSDSGKFTIYDNNTRYGIYVNNVRIQNSYELESAYKE